MFDLEFYYTIAIIRNFKKISEEINSAIMKKRKTYTHKEKNEMDYYLDYIAGLYYYYMNNQDLKSYIISYSEYFDMDIPIYIEKVEG